MSNNSLVNNLNITTPKDDFGTYLCEAGPYGVLMASGCEKYGMTYGCDTECPVLLSGKCELMYSDNKELYNEAIKKYSKNNNL